MLRNAYRLVKKKRGIVTNQSYETHKYLQRQADLVRLTKGDSDEDENDFLRTGELPGFSRFSELEKRNRIDEIKMRKFQAIGKTLTAKTSMDESKMRECCKLK